MTNRLLFSILACTLLLSTFLNGFIFTDKEPFKSTFTDEITYLNWDNQTKSRIEDLLADPLLIIRSSPRCSNHDDSITKGYERVGSFDFLSGDEETEILLINKDNNLLIPNTYFLNQESSKDLNVIISSKENNFHHIKPTFNLTCSRYCEKIRWQIDSEPDFSSVISSLDSIQENSVNVTLNDLDETFLDNDTTYFFRVKGFSQGSWGQWSSPFAFEIKKPNPVENIHVQKSEKGSSILAWESSDQNVTYLIFGSNALDFIPSIYSPIQINTMVDGIPQDVSSSDNFLVETSDTKWIVDQPYAYYRIIVKNQNQLSKPSKLFPFYDGTLPPERSILQKASLDTRSYLKRVSIPLAYSWIQKRANSLSGAKYVRNPYITEELWNSLSSYFLPENFPEKAALDRLFKKNLLKSCKALRNAGFIVLTNPKYNVLVAKHNTLKGYLVKAYLNNHKGVDWYWWKRRIDGARVIQNSIDQHGYQSIMKVPKKWIYPLPIDSTVINENNRKHFILLVEDMNILNDYKNRKAYKTKMNPVLLDALYTMLMENLLIDSIYAKNVPFCKDGKLAFIDTEHVLDHSRPVPISHVAQYLSSDMHAYWEQLIVNGVTN